MLFWIGVIAMLLNHLSFKSALISMAAKPAADRSNASTTCNVNITKKKRKILTLYILVKMIHILLKIKILFYE